MTQLLTRAQAGITSVCTTYPLDLVRSRLSLATASVLHAAPLARAELSMRGMMAKVFREEGGLRGARPPPPYVCVC
jgi:solute carrier family 25 phosphate transporter 23/24/25/41